MPETALLLDIGNTTVKFGLAGLDTGPSFGAFLGLPPVVSLPSDHAATPDLWGMRILELCRARGVEPGHVSRAVACSVVPALSATIGEALDRWLGAPMTLVPEQLPIPIENRYARPEEVGADRLLAAWAARRRFPEPPALISIDYGTATTFDCVQGQAYLGGLICPGVGSSIAALAGRTAKLPQITLTLDESGEKDASGASRAPRVPRIGRSTRESLNQGFLLGFAAMTEGVVARLKTVLGPGTIVVGTGGYAEKLAAVTDAFDHLVPDLLMDGLRVLMIESK